MTFFSDDLDDVAYDFLGYANELLYNLDISDESNLIRRAIELQAFSVSLYYPRLSQLDVTRKGPTPQVDMIAVARRHAAVKLYEYYARRTRRGRQIKKNTSSSKWIKESLGRKVGRNQILKVTLRWRAADSACFWKILRRENSLIR
jgi:hypothetical protein